jgi:methionyl-tRNA formyltransferase
MIKIVFFGNEQLAQGLDKPITPTFDGLIASPHQVVALVLPRRAEAVSRKARPLEIVEAADRHGVNIIYANETNLSETLQRLSADIGVLVSYGKIVPQSVIDAFPHGIINIHPSLLPKYRGSTPLETAIVNGDSQTGVSLMQLSREMDAGPVYVQAKILLSPDETKYTLYQKAITVGSKLLLENLADIVNGKLKPTEQDDTEATFTQLLTKSDGNLSPSQMTATECERKIRAYLGWPRTRLDFHGQQTIVTAAKALGNFDGDNWSDLVKCADNSALQIIEIISPTSGKRMKTTDYLRGLKPTQ